MFVLWTTFICNGGEVAEDHKRITHNQRFFSTHLYSSEIYTSKEEVNRQKNRWHTIYLKDRIKDPNHCIGFMIQEEEISSKVMLKEIMRLY